MRSDSYAELGEAAWRWVLGQVRDDDGPWLPDVVREGYVPDAEPPSPAWDRDCLYNGIAGLAPLLAEITLHRPLDESEQALRTGIVERLQRQVPTRTDGSLYDGLAGDAVALRLLTPGTETAALQRIDVTTTEVTDVIGGYAGMAFAGAWVGGPDGERVVASSAEALLRSADRTPAGLDWAMRPDYPSRMPNFSHGTAGNAAALAVAGAVLGRGDLVDAAVAGARHLLSVGSLDDDGFVAPHTIPPSARLVEPVTYTWCHGPTGSSYLFAALQRAGVEEVDGHAVADLRRRCLRAVLAAGVPRRLRPGFWDNDGRCCGTAGVGSALLDAAQDAAGGSARGTPADTDEPQALTDAAVLMADALVERVIRDGDLAFWRFVEHREDPPLLPPSTSWMQGAAGIAAFLLRLSRVLSDGLDAPVIDLPDSWFAVPTALRAAGATRTSPRP